MKALRKTGDKREEFKGDLLDSRASLGFIISRYFRD